MSMRVCEYVDMCVCGYVRMWICEYVGMVCPCCDIVARRKKGVNMYRP